MTLNFCTYNVNGLLDSVKRRSVFGLLKTYQVDIALLQETHCTNDKVRMWQAEWGSNIYCSNYHNCTRGVMVLFKKGLSYTVERMEIDSEGRYLVMEIRVHETRYLIANIYAPNSDEPQFFHKVAQTIDSFDNCNIIWGGDFNLVMEVYLDRYQSDYNNIRSCQVLKTYLEQFELVDIWRVLNPEAVRYTWYRALRSMSRIDFFLINVGLCTSVKSCEIISTPLSDHRPVLLKIMPPDLQRGPGVWKFNVLHLSNKQFVKGIKDIAQNVVNHSGRLSPDDRWEYIKNEIRDYCIAESKKIASKNKKEYIGLCNESDKLQQQVDADPISVSPRVLASLQEIKIRIAEISEAKAKGAIMRCKIKYYQEGERSSRYFFSLEKARANQKKIAMLKLETGLITTDQKTIMQEQVKFYKNLYTTDPTIRFDLALAKNDGVLTVDQRVRLDGALTPEEMYDALKKMAPNKTPGIDGLPAELYKVLWNIIVDPFFQMVSVSLEKGFLPRSVSKGLIALIPKKGKDLTSLNNWRPLTMLNVDYKIVAKALAGRLQSVLPDVIDGDQTGFMKNRNIATNIRKAIEIAEFVEKTDQPAIMLSIDYHKCFDLIEHDAIWGALRGLNFGEKFISMVQTLFNNFQSCIQSNGYLSEFFDITRSVHQGSPISTFLFLCCSQYLTSLIKNNADIKGVLMHGVNHVISQFADDTDLFLRFEIDTLLQVCRTLDIVYKNIGFKVNYDKTTIYRMGSVKNSNAMLYTGKPFKWTNSPPNVLGVDISLYDDRASVDGNFLALIKKSEAILHQWRYRSLTLSGKVLVVNTLVASLFVYKMSVLPNMSYTLIQQFETIIDKFLGNGKKSRIPLKILQLPKEQGGLQLVDLYKRQLALKMQWVIQIRDKELWANIAYTYLTPALADKLWICNFSVNDLETLFPIRSFWRQVVYAWASFNFYSPKTTQEILNQVIWYNSHIRVQDFPLTALKAWEKGLVKISQLFDDNGILHSYQYINANYPGALTWFQHAQIISAIPHEWRQTLLSDSITLDILLTPYEKFINENKISQQVYRKLIGNSAELTSVRIKWQMRLLREISETEFNKMFNNIKLLTISTKLRDFQFRLLHNKIVTNRQLYIWRKRTDDLCTFCQIDMEHTLHLFFECGEVQNIWNAVKQYFQDKSGGQLDSLLRWTAESIMFNTVHPKTSSVINLIILIAKQYIYKCRCLQVQLSSQMLKMEIESVYKIEEAIARKTGRLRLHCAKWETLQDVSELVDIDNNYVQSYINDM